MSNDIDETARTIGRIEGTLTAQKESMDAHMAREERDRDIMFKTLSELKDAVSHLSGLHDSSDKHEARLQDLERLRDKALAISVSAAAIFTAIFEGFRAFGHDFIGWLRH